MKNQTKKSQSGTSKKVTTKSAPSNKKAVKSTPTKKVTTKSSPVKKSTPTKQAPAKKPMTKSHTKASTQTKTRTSTAHKTSTSNKKSTLPKINVSKNNSKKPSPIQNNNPQSQQEIVLNHLLNHGSINTHEAITKYGILRLGAIIFNLKKGGAMTIKTNLLVKKNPGRNSSKMANYSIN
jgi:hypothetical protein